MSEISGYGISVSVPADWDAQIYLTTSPTDNPEGISSPTMHAASFPLPPDDLSSYGSTLVADMTENDVFMAMVEYAGADATGVLFTANDHLPQFLTTDAFSPWILQRSLPGQGGAQYFFTESGRAFCLYVVLGSFSNAVPLVAEVNDVLPTITITPAT